LVPFTQFAADLATSALPNYSFLVPNLCHDGHDCPLSTADGWLQANIAPLIGSSQFQQDGLLVILFDEASNIDSTNGGGRVAWVAVSAKSKRGYRSTTMYQHESTLRLAAEALGLGVLPNRAAFAPDMREFFIP
jgi:acid phosphatase